MSVGSAHLASGCRGCPELVKPAAQPVCGDAGKHVKLRVGGSSETHKLEAWSKRARILNSKHLCAKRNSTSASQPAKRRRAQCRRERCEIRAFPPALAAESSALAAAPAVFRERRVAAVESASGAAKRDLVDGRKENLHVKSVAESVQQIRASAQRHGNKLIYLFRACSTDR